MGPIPVIAVATVGVGKVIHDSNKDDSSDNGEASRIGEQNRQNDIQRQNLKTLVSVI